MKTYSNTPRFQNAYAKGYAARKAGETRLACPYNSRGQGGARGNIPTGARAYANAWLAGWSEADEKGGDA